MKTTAAAMMCGLVATAALIAGCNSAQSDWTNASARNTASAYQSFISAHPNDGHLSEAKARIRQLQDGKAWGDAQTTSSEMAYQGYLKQFPQGAHAADASLEIETIDRTASWAAVQSANTATAIQGFLDKYPSGPEADQARASIKQMTGYSVHVLTEPSKPRAARKLAGLQSRLGDKASKLQITPLADGKHFSVDSEGMSDQEARQTCDALWHVHEGCQVVGQKLSSIRR